MNVLKKRFIPCVLACALMLAMAAPAFASSSSKYSTEIEGNFVEAVIDVTVPTTARAFINPYALPVKLTKLNDESTAPDITEGSAARPGHSVTAGSILNQQIVTEPMFIINRSEVNLAVTATVKAEYPMRLNTEVSPNKLVKDTDLNFTTEAITSENTGKDVFAYLQMKVAGDLSATSTAQDQIDAFTQWTDDTYNQNRDLVVGTSGNGNSKGSLVILKAGEASGGDVDNMEATKGSIAMFRIAGQVVTEPGKPWDANKDKFTMTVAFTFKPDTIKATITANPNNAKALTSTSGSIELTAKLTGAPTGTEEKPVVGTKLVSVAWSSSDTTSTNSTLTENITATTNDKCRVTAKDNITNQDVVITAIITADNGLTYKQTYTININTAP